MFVNHLTTYRKIFEETCYDVCACSSFFSKKIIKLTHVDIFKNQKVNLT